MTIPRRSLRLRVTLFATAVVAVVLAGSGYALVQWLQTSQITDADAALSDQVDLVAGLAQQGVIPNLINPTGLNTGQVQVVAPDRAVLSYSPGLAAEVRLDVFMPPPVGSQIARTTTAAELGASGSDRFRVVSRSVSYGFDWVSIYAVSSLQSADQVVRTLVVGLWIVLPILVLLSALATWYLTGRALRPVDAMRREVDAIQGSRTDQRLSADQRAAELDRLADTLNGLLDRISVSDATRRQFLADASHELRSPIASARTMLEVGLAYPDRTDWQLTAGEVMVEVDRLQELASELLALARVEGGERAVELRRVDLAALVADEVQRGNDPRVVLHAVAPVWVMADRPLVVRAVRNLLDNARRHAASKVTVNVGGDDARASMHVHNDGDEIPLEERERIFEPFTRLDNARARDEGGAGLGLSLARRIAAAHDGTLEVVEVTNGAAFLLTLPVATPTSE
jgi:signal transduction histidine kinase